MKLTHETLIRSNPAQILLPRFTVSQIMRNDQQVSFRIFFTANYNAFKARDYLVVKYAQPDQDGLPLTDKDGYVKYFKPITDPEIPANGLVFGTLRYNPANDSYDIDWTQSTVSDDPQPSDMLIPEPVEIRVKKAKQSRILKSVTPTEKALSSATLDSRSKTRLSDESSKTDDQREAEVVVMNVAIPAPESYVQVRKVQYEESVQTYASRMADVPDTPLGTVVSCNVQLTPSVNTPPEQQKPKDKRYKVTPRGRVVAVRSDRLNEPAPLWVPDGIRTLPPTYEGDDTADNLFLTPTRVVDGQRFTYWNPAMKFYLRKYNEDNVMGSDTSFPPSQSSQDPSIESSTADDLSSETILVADPTGGAIPYFENNEQRDKFFKDLRKEPGAYAKIRRSLGEKTFGSLVQARYDNREHIREMLEESSIERDILISGSVIHLTDEPDTPDSTTQDSSENIDSDSSANVNGDSNISEPRGLTSQLRVVHTTSDVEEITVNDEGGMDEDLDDGETVIEDIIEEEDGEEEGVEENGEEVKENGEGAGENGDDDNYDDMGGITAPPAQDGGVLPPSNQGDVVTPNTPNELVPPNNQDSVLDPEPVIPKRAHLRPFKSHFEPGYDTATGDLVWKVRLGFDGAFDSFEDYVRVFTDAICKRVQEEAYMASEGRMVVDPKEIIDGLAMLAQKRLYFRSNPGYVYCYWDHCSPRLRRLFQPPHYFRDHYSRHLYWYLICGTANCTELKDNTFRILIGRHAFVGRAEEITIASHVPITIPGNSFFNPMKIEIRDENDELYELETPYIVEWTFTPLRAA
ncbi:Hypothetical protein GLP15_2189 [Giardia lamblia P15]|uniref:Uncharacterized protein n=1 Tax=Giardia intestinalis (strain P15) TaxID=658858 RepID=E1F6W2_GIAIA|nr:Hypothetical protein GLP15_2189 [Giardia lamblia P15]